MSRVSRGNPIVWLMMCALAGCGKTVQLEPEMTDPQAAATQAAGDERYDRAMAALQNNELTKAQRILTELAQLRPDSVGVWINLGLVHFKRQDLDSAQKAVDEALRLVPDVAEGLNLKGLIEYQRGHVQAARDYYQAALRQNADYGLAHYNLALVYDVYFRDIAKAVKHYRRYLALDGQGDEETMVWVGELEAVLRQSSRGDR